MSKTKVKKGKASFKGIIFLLLILAIIAGVVCAIVFWPKRPSEIKTLVFTQANNVLSSESENDFLANYSDFTEYAKTYFESEGKTAELLQKNSTDIALNTLNKYFNYLNYTFEFADFAMYDQIDFQNVKDNLNKVKNTADKMAIFLKEKNETLTSPSGDTRAYAKSDAELVWMGIKKDLGQMIGYYQLATESLSKIYAKNVNKGVYANEFANKAVEGVGFYLNYMSTNYEKVGTQGYYNMALKFQAFSKYFDKKDGGYVFSKYYSSSTIQNNTTVICNFEKQFEDYTLKQFVLDELTYAGKNFTEIQIGHAEGASIFYTGGFVA